MCLVFRFLPEVLRQLHETSVGDPTSQKKYIRIQSLTKDHHIRLHKKADSYTTVGKNGFESYSDPNYDKNTNRIRPLKKVDPRRNGSGSDPRKKNCGSNSVLKVTSEIKKKKNLLYPDPKHCM